MNASTAHNLTGTTALVTGASSGIGRAIALELAGAGADVLIHARALRAKAQETAQTIIGMGRRAEVVLADLSQQQQHEALVDRAWCWNNRVDIWVNNAGADVLTGDAANWSFERKLEYLWRVDVAATVRLSRLVGQRMKQQRGNGVKGVIVNMGWDQAQHGMSGDSGEMFAAVKGAIMAFTKSLARSLAPDVRVNCLAPGWIRTAWGGQASPYWQQRACDESLLQRWGTPEDVARAARFVVSPAADFVTGQIIPVNGGFQWDSAHRDAHEAEDQKGSS
jgi:3-oxoacyl-[acyl-carrier protein] reductase